MSNYTKTTDFGAKDSLPTGDSGKIIRGTEFETEFDAISTAIATKADIAGPTFTGTLTYETISDGTISITGFVDEDDMSSDSVNLVPTQQSVKAYVDSVTTELQAQDLDFQADSGGALSIDLDTETMTFTGGTGITTTGLANDVTFAIDSTVATLTGTQTLTNKTLTSPDVNTPDIDGGTIDGTVIGGTTAAAGSFTTVSATGNITVDGTVDGRDVATDGTKLDGIESGATADQTAAEIRTLVDSATDSNVFTDADHTKLDGIEANATADQTAAEIRTLVDSATDSNVFTDADHTKLDGIEALADVTDTTNVTAAGAVMDSELTNETAVKSLDQGVATTDSPTFAGLTTTADVSFGDNDKAIFGAGSDLQIYHDSNNSYIKDAGTGYLVLGGQDTGVAVQNGSGQNLILTGANAVTLSYGSGSKLATTSTGIDVTGTAVTDGVTIDGSLTFQDDASFPTTGLVLNANTYLYQRGGSGGIIFSDASGTNEISRFTGSTVTFNEDGRDADFRVESDNNSSMFVVDAGADFVDIGGAGNIGGQLNIIGGEGIRGKKASAYKTATMVQPTGWGYSTATYAVTQLGDQSTQGTVSIGYDPSSNTNGSFSGTGIEMLFGGDMHFYQPNSADNGWKKQFRMVNTAGVIINDNSDADLDFRVESDSNTHALFVEGSSSSVGINENSPNAILHVKTSDTTEMLRLEMVDDSSTIGPDLVLQRQSASPAANDVIGRFRAIGENSSGSGVTYGRMEFVIDDPTAGSEDGRITFATELGGANIQRLALKPDEVVFNESSVDSDFRVESNGNTHALYVNAGSDGVGMGATSSPVNAAVTEGLFYSIGGSLTVASNTETLQINRNGTGGNNRANIGLYNNGTLRGTIGTLGGQDGLYFQSGGNVDNLQMQDGANIFNESSADINFRVESDNQTHALFVDAGNDRVGIFNSSPGQALDVGGTIMSSSTAGGFMRMKRDDTTLTNNADVGAIDFETTDSDDAGVAATILASGDGTAGGVKLRFYAGKASNKTERLTLYNSGVAVFNEDGNDFDFRVESNNDANCFYVDAGNDRVLVGNNAASTGQDFFSVDARPGTSGQLVICGRDDNSTKNQIVFRNPNGTVGSIQTAASATSYNTSSDARLKENIADADDAGELIDAIQVRQFDWIADGEHQRYGMVAQELNTVAPEAVSEGETEDDMMAVDYSKLVPMLVKEIQSLRARVAQLESTSH